MLDKDTYYLKKTKMLMLSIFNMVAKTEELALKETALNQELSVAEAHTLVAIGRHHKKTMSQIAAELLINVSTLSIAVNKLEKKGCARRIKRKDDRRVVEIVLTEKGRKALEEHEKFYYNLVEETISNMDEESKKLFISSLENMASFFENKLAELEAGQDESEI